MRKITGIIALLLCFSGAAAQVAEPSDSLELIHQTSDAKFYKYNYPSHSANGEDVVLSSLLVAWQPKKPVVTDSIESLHIFSHYTIAADRECPTSSSNTTERTLFGMLAKGKYGLGLTPAYNFISRCVIIAPDYEGYGVSKDRPHPYLSERLTAQQVVDGVEYGLGLYQKHVNDERALAFRSDWRSFSFGYSQGGAVAYKACLTDPEYTCGINIDGGLFGDHNGMTMNKPFMQLSCEDNENVVTKGYLNHSKPAYKVLFRGMKHMGFADIKFGMKPGMMAGKLDAESAHKYSCRSFLEFFDCYLKKTKDKPDLTSDDVITVTEFAPDVK